MKTLVTFLAQRRKYLTAAAAGTLPVIAHYLSVGPHISSGAVWYTFIVAEFFALGVHAVTNDPA